MNPQAAQNYLRTRVQTATPEQLQMMLYDGAIRFAEQTKLAIVKKDWEAVYLNSSRAQKIVAELNNGLKHSIAPDMCGKLASLYNFIYRKLTQASTQHTLESIEEALRLLHYQRETWVMLLDRLTKEKAAAAANKIDLPAPNARMEAMISMQG